MRQLKPLISLRSTLLLLWSPVWCKSRGQRFFTAVRNVTSFFYCKYACQVAKKTPVFVGKKTDGVPLSSSSCPACYHLFSALIAARAGARAAIEKLQIEWGLWEGSWGAPTSTLCPHPTLSLGCTWGLCHLLLRYCCKPKLQDPWLSRGSQGVQVLSKSWKPRSPGSHEPQKSGLGVPHAWQRAGSPENCMVLRFLALYQGAWKHWGPIWGNP